MRIGRSVCHPPTSGCGNIRTARAGGRSGRRAASNASDRSRGNWIPALRWCRCRRRSIPVPCHICMYWQQSSVMMRMFDCVGAAGGRSPGCAMCRPKFVSYRLPLLLLLWIRRTRIWIAVVCMWADCFSAAAVAAAVLSSLVVFMVF